MNAGRSASSANAGAAAVGGGAGAGGAAGHAATAGAAGDANGTAGVAAAGSGGSSDFKRPCVSSGNEVVLIGDSYSDYPPAHQSLASFMEALATKAGALATGDHYRNLAMAATTLAQPPAGIQSQWQGTKSMTPIKAVVMDGGGNDVLLNTPQCRPEGSEKNAECMQVVQDSIDAAKMLLESMKETGVSDVVYFWYPHIPGGALTGFESGISISDYTYPLLVDVANAATTDTFHVYMVPTVEIFEGHPDYFFSDGLHANDVGEAKIADAIWKVMQDNCIAQGPNSGCCGP
jgi:hypothetical protein